MKLVTDLSDFLIPKISEYEPDFGTMKESGGLTTKEVSENIMYPLLSQRGFTVTESSQTSDLIARNSKFLIEQENVTLTIGRGIDGVEISVFNRSAGNANIVVNGITFPIQPKKQARWEWVFDEWVSIIDKYYPVGFIYVQYPNQKDPNELFNGTMWEDVSNLYGGLFFRVFKSNVTADFGDVQNAQLPNIQGSIDGLGNRVGFNTHRTPGALHIYNMNTENYIPNIGENLPPHHSCHTFDFNASWYDSRYVDGGEVRPENTAIKLFKRIA